MKRLLVALTVLVAILSAPRQATAELRYGPMLGINMSTLKFKQSLFEVNKVCGMSAGVATEVIFPGIGFGISSGIYYEMRGAKLHLGDKEVWREFGTVRSYLHYLEIPIHLRFKWTRMAGLEDYVAPFVFGGPSFSLLFGHSHIKALEYANGEMGLTVGGGLEIKRNWQVSYSFTWGMVYAEQTKLLDHFSAKNRTMDIRVTYLF
ncbi:porin family protein [uncultured Muribaculum sp.]|uniref:porin family protein n=1 Tax=uncultured Muribaculum sp. TaxID=1918613 RepID=UPI0025CFEE9F|nr:porin family protein [uncultured Muribaculum sp.]